MDRVHESADHNGHGPWLTMATAAEGLVGAHAQGRSGGSSPRASVVGSMVRRGQRR
jgi:hypothetical protein